LQAGKLTEQQLRQRLQRALDIAGNTHDVSDVVDAIKAGRMQAFSGPDAFVVTETVSAPRKRYLNVFLAVGDLDEVMFLQPQLEAFGKEHGCEFIIMHGRKGWSRVLPNFGWQEAGVTYALPLQETAHG
jgi:hypothetical protein